MRGAGRAHNRVHFMMSDFRAVIDESWALFYALSQDIIMSKTLSYRLFRVFPRSVDKVLRYDRKAKAMNVVVESSQGDANIHATLQDDLSGGIEGKFVMQNQEIKLADQGKIITDFKRWPMSRSTRASFFAASVRRIGNIFFKLRIEMNHPTTLKLPINS